VTSFFNLLEEGSPVDRESFKQEAVLLRGRLLAAQKRLAVSPLSVVILVNGVEGAGKGEMVNRLLEWMDARGIETHAFWMPTEEEKEHPDMWRFWRELPGRGKIGIFFGSWYTRPIIERVFRQTNHKEFSLDLENISEFERMLVHEDTLVIKFWMHLSPDDQKKHIKKMKKDPETRWRITDTARKFFKKRKRFAKVDDEALSVTSTNWAPWHLIDARDRRYRELKAAKILLERLNVALDEAEKREERIRVPQLPPPPRVNFLAGLDQTRTLRDEEYQEKFKKLQAKIGRLSDRLSATDRTMVVVFEGPDAAGKGGAIRRLISSMDARHYRVIAFSAPTDEERAHPYLWRFWRHVPGSGRVAIFDRSWYGRVLVERIEGFCIASEWQRAYGEIRSFERELADHGAVIVKFWLATTAEEQLKRFKDREITPYKQYKLTPEDWRNRAKWDAYESAACEMIEKTATPYAPWIPVEANDKNHARIKVMQTVADLLTLALE